MTIRTLIAFLRELERTTDALSRDCESDRPAPGAAMRELDRRRSDGIDVRLLWNQAEGRVRLAVYDAKTSDAFELEVEPHLALEAFHHPYSYAASLGGSVNHPRAAQTGATSR